MKYLTNTIGFALIQTVSGSVASLWLEVAHARFKFDHPTGQGVNIANFYWDYSWWYLSVVAFFVSCLTLLAWRNKDKTYWLATYFGYALLILWIGFAIIAMEVCRIPEVHLYGNHY
jgi:hypothetical protein